MIKIPLFLVLDKPPRDLLFPATIFERTQEDGKQVVACKVLMFETIIGKIYLYPCVRVVSIPRNTLLLNRNDRHTY